MSDGSRPATANPAIRLVGVGKTYADWTVSGAIGEARTA